MNTHLRYIGNADINLVLARIPPRYLSRLGEINVTAEHHSVRCLGYVSRRGRRDITLCGFLPPRLSLRRFMFDGDHAAQFGASDRGQWPPWAIRRKLLYSTLLHEIGHLQVVDDVVESRRRFAREPVARAFAAELRGWLYSQPFEHPDPIHFAPSEEELAMRPWWDSLDKQMRFEIAWHILVEDRRSSGFAHTIPPPYVEFIERCVRIRTAEALPTRLRSQRRDEPAQRLSR